jgi:hypothetical protein
MQKGLSDKVESKLIIKIWMIWVLGEAQEVGSPVHKIV